MSVRLPERTPVVIVGGGPVGLTASLLLARRGIENVVVERREGTIRAPAAHVLRPRTMETFDRIGAGDEVRETAPLKRLDYIIWCTTLGGAEVGRLDAHADGSGGLGWTNCPQNLLEPILLRHAQREPASRVVHGAEWTGLAQRDGGVRATVRTRDGAERAIDADWLIAADGAGSPVRRALGIPMVGQGPLGRFWMIHLDADLRPWIDDRPSPLFWIMNPDAQGVLIVHDPARSFVFMTAQRGVAGERETLPARLAAALAVDVEPHVLSVDEWSPHVQVAERYREGRVLLVGDAAHRFPPTGGLGLNTGISEADFLVHGLAAAIEGGGGACGLDRYEVECRPVAQANAADSFENLGRLAEIPTAIGPVADLAALEARLAGLSPAERKQLDQAIEHQRSHFASHGRLPPDPRTLDA